MLLSRAVFFIRFLAVMILYSASLLRSEYRWHAATGVGGVRGLFVGLFLSVRTIGDMQRLVLAGLSCAQVPHSVLCCDGVSWSVQTASWAVLR